MNSNQQRLIEAAKKGKVAEVNSLLEQKIEVNSSNTRDSALYGAINALYSINYNSKETVDYIKVIALLVEKGARICDEGETLQNEANAIIDLCANYPEIRKILLKAKMLYPSPMLKFFAKKGEYAFVEKLLLEKQADPNLYDPSTNRTFLYQTILSLNLLNICNKNSNFLEKQLLNVILLMRLNGASLLFNLVNDDFTIRSNSQTIKDIKKRHPDFLEVENAANKKHEQLSKQVQVIYSKELSKIIANYCFFGGFDPYTDAKEMGQETLSKKGKGRIVVIFNWSAGVKQQCCFSNKRVKHSGKRE